MTPKNLVKAKGAQNVEDLRSRFLAEIFQGEEEALNSLKRASNGFEHGYMATGAVRGLMEPILERSLTCVRSALVRASGVDEETVKSCCLTPTRSLAHLFQLSISLRKAGTNRPSYTNG
jgi:hypothetical protein